MAAVVAVVVAAGLVSCAGGGSDSAKKATAKATSDTGSSSKPKADKKSDTDTGSSDTGASDTADSASTDDTTFSDATDTLDSSEPTMTDAGAQSKCGEAGSSLDHCYQRKDMQDYLDYTISNFVEPWIASHYTNFPPPANYVYIGDGETADSGCGTQDDQAYAYCPADNSIYVGQAFQWYLYKKFGAIGPAVAIAHEYGHHIQTVKNVPNPAEGTPEEVNNEDQADCVAGSWVFWADNNKLVQYPKDLENVAALMAAISDAESPTQTHGTSSQRTKSFSVGYGSDLQACNSFYPNTPILP